MAGKILISACLMGLPVRYNGSAKPLLHAAVERWRENRARLDAAALDPREVARRLELLEHEATEIAGARLRPGEADEITARLTAAQHGEAIARGAAALREALTSEGRGARDATATATRLRFFVAGLSLGIAMLFTQKILMALPAVAICAAIHVFDASGTGERTARLRSVALLGAGVAAPLLSLLAAYAMASPTDPPAGGHGDGDRGGERSVGRWHHPAADVRGARAHEGS